ncbi:hypothetical protein OROMI_030583 [Orobanche minor]
MFTSEYSILECPPPPLSNPTFLVNRTAAATKWKCSNMEIAPNCPRCASTNTKFCYYNNYSLSQPRYFCKACRRYWTKGGSLRNVPIGGGCRKSRRARSTRQGVGQKYTGPPTLSPAGGPGRADTEPDSGTRIDLAAVYAKYVNPNFGNEESSSPGASSGSSADNNMGGSSLDHGTDGQIEDVAMMSEYQEMLPVDLISGGDDQIQQLVPQFSAEQEIDGRDFAGQDFDDGGFEMMTHQQLGMGMIGDQALSAAADVLWSEEGAALPNYGSQVQPVMQQVQDFGLFSPDDQFRISANLVVDNLGSFDPSTYGFFFNP